MTESKEAKAEPKQVGPRYDPFENPGPLAEEEAEFLNALFPGLDISSGHVRAVISNHAAFQKSESRQKNREAESAQLAQDRQARKEAHADRVAANAVKKAEAAQRKAERDAKKEADAAEKASRPTKVASKPAKAASDDTPAPKPVAKKRPARKPKPAESEVEDGF
jgi:ATPase subunit of ABC transporter with duplicated ATPase domains